jgi:hypothetical protein
LTICKYFYVANKHNGSNNIKFDTAASFFRIVEFVFYNGGTDAGFQWGSLRKGNHLEDPGVDGDNIKMELLEVGCRHRLDRSDSG